MSEICKSGLRRGAQSTPASFHTKPRYSLAETAQLLGISERNLRQRIQQQQIESHMDGRRRFVTARAIDVYIAAAEAASSSGAPA